MAEQNGEKSFEPTRKKRDDAAKEGDVLRSRELATALAMIVGVGWLWMTGGALSDALQDAVRAGFTWDRQSLASFRPGEALMQAAMIVAPPLAMLGAASVLAAVAGSAMLGDVRFMPALAGFKAKRINPVSGLKRMFGPNGLIELAKAMVKVVFLGAISWAVLAPGLPVVLGGGDAPLHSQVGAVVDLTLWLLAALAAGLLAIALADVPIQMIRQTGRLRMTHQEMRDEHKETEGAPEKKAAVRERQREIARGSVHRAMQQADFVVTNPTHFAVALRYDALQAPAPVVLARGRGVKALAIRELAAERKLPVLEYPELARGLYFSSKDNAMIREELYQAVAAVLAFVMALRRGEAPPRPEVTVPAALRFDEFGRRESVAG